MEAYLAGIYKNRIYLRTDRLNWLVYNHIKRALYSVVNRNKQDSIVLDISNIRRIYPNGIVPVICEVNRLKRLGANFQLIPPQDEDTRKYCEALGWLHFLAPEEYPLNEKNRYQNFALHRFKNVDELNEVINGALDICLKHLIFESGVPQAFEWTINEIAGNVLVHAGIEEGFLQVLVDRVHNKLNFIVCDFGVGIPYNIKKAFPDIKSDKIAIEHAIKKGVTSNPKHGQGNGLAGSVAIAIASNSNLFITSKAGRVQVMDGRVKSERQFPPFEGTCVEMQFNTQVTIDLPRTLWGNKPVSYFETRYENDLGDLMFKLKDHSKNFGNRPTGERLRTLVYNLLLQNPGHSVVIDMEDIPLIASSFADELFGKLAADLGILDFSRLIKITNVNAVCKEIIDVAIKQRIVQNYGAHYVTLVDDIQQA